MMDIDGKHEWRDCLEVPGVRLPRGYYFGTSSITGDLSGAARHAPHSLPPLSYPALVNPRAGQGSGLLPLCCQAPLPPPLTCPEPCCWWNQVTSHLVLGPPAQTSGHICAQRLLSPVSTSSRTLPHNPRLSESCYCVATHRALLWASPRSPLLLFQAAALTLGSLHCNISNTSATFLPLLISLCHA